VTFENSSLEPAITYEWTLAPSNAGNLSNGGITATVTWSAAYHGYAYIKVFAWNSCGTRVSDSLEVFVYNSVGISDNDQGQPLVSVMPNPNKGNFRVSIAGVKDDMKMSIFSSDGALIETRSIGNENRLLEFNYGGLPKGLYFLRIYNDKMNLLNKVILQ